MARWLGDLTAAQIEAMNAKNRAHHVKGREQHDGTEKAKTAQIAPRAIPVIQTLTYAPLMQPTPLESTNRGTPDGMEGPTRRRRNASRMLPRPTEHEEQVATVTWWNGWAPQHGYDPRLLFAVPNGAILGGDARLRSIQIGRLKASGFRNGVPDLMLAVRQTWLPDSAAQAWGAGLFLELKRQGVKAVPDAQAEYHALLRAQGYRVEVCAGMEAAKAAILAYLGISASTA